MKITPSPKYGILLLFLHLVGCDLTETITPCADGHCRPPVEAISEIEMLGITISTNTRPLPDTIQVQTITRETDGEQFIFSNSLNLFFSPLPGFDEVLNPDPVANVKSDHRYAYTFSIESENGSSIIKPFNPFYSQDYVPLEGSSFGPLMVTDTPSELIRFGNFILEGVSMFPTRATHIELWFREDVEYDFEIVSRTPIASFLAWRTYLEPNI